MMSNQVRDLVERSVSHFAERLNYFFVSDGFVCNINLLIELQVDILMYDKINNTFKNHDFKQINGVVNCLH